MKPSLAPPVFLIVGLGLFAPAAYAQFDLDVAAGSGGVPGPVRCSSGTQVNGIAETDVTIEGNAAADCWGTYDGNDPKNIGLETGGMIYDFLTRYNNGGPTEGTDIGLSFDTNNGTFEYTDAIGNDFFVVLKQQNNPGWAAWLFEDEDQIQNATGTYQIAWQNNGTDLSHMSIYRKQGNGGGPGQAPEPGTLVLLAAGSLGLAARRRRRRS